MPPLPPNIYLATAPGIDSPLLQGEILTGLIEHRLVSSSLTDAAPEFTPVTHPYALILSQDCDLEQDYRVRFPLAPNSDKLVPSILFCEASDAESVLSADGMNSKISKRIAQNNDDRYQFLQKAIPASRMLADWAPELVLDFKRYFTVPTDVVYRQVELEIAQRLCVLQNPYLEHLSHRFASYLSRVALPHDHSSE